MKKEHRKLQSHYFIIYIKKQTKKKHNIAGEVITKIWVVEIYDVIFLSCEVVTQKSYILYIFLYMYI